MVIKNNNNNEHSVRDKRESIVPRANCEPQSVKKEEFDTNSVPSKNINVEPTDSRDDLQPSRLVTRSGRLIKKPNKLNL